MIGLFIVAHGKLAEAYKSTAEHMLGSQRQLAALGISSDECFDTQKKRLMHLVREMDDGDGVLIVNDIIGATPANIAIAAVENSGLKIVFGANLPLIVRLVEVRNRCTLEELARAGKQAGQKHIYTCEDVCCRLKQNPFSSPSSSPRSEVSPPVAKKLSKV